jgi:hypothetical protein
MDIEQNDRGTLYDGRPCARSGVRNGASPYVELAVVGITGLFPLDYGATRNSMSANAFPGPDG